MLPADEALDDGSEDRVRLLAPFDPVVWDRRRFELFWGWDYRFEAYTPPAKRRFGYYALPLLWRDDVDRLGERGACRRARLPSTVGFAQDPAARRGVRARAGSGGRMRSRTAFGAARLRDRGRMNDRARRWLFLIPTLIWGSTWLAITFQLGIVAPEVSVCYRFALASLRARGLVRGDRPVAALLRARSRVTWRRSA